MAISVSAEELVVWTGGVWHGNHGCSISGMTFDSRAVKSGDIFVALKSDKADGHNYLSSAFTSGAVCAIVSAEWFSAQTAVPPEEALLVVPDTYKAMHDIAAAYRRKINPFVVGVTGSVGKSTVKTWTAALLSRKYRTSSTIANFNNGIGLPVSLVSMPQDSQYGVFEIGMNHKGELVPLCRTLLPNAAIITAIGPVHIEFFDSVEAIADEKAELFRAVGEDGFAVVDAASPYFSILASSTAARVVTVLVDDDGSHNGADFVACDIDALSGTFTIDGKLVDEPRRVSTGIPGRHNVLNALYATAAARMCSVSWDEVIAGLADLPTMKMRWEHKTINGVNWVNDAYNANPVAMAAALRTFNDEVNSGRRIYVLGEMKELGEASRRFHNEIGALVGELGGDVFVGVGDAGKWMTDSAVNNGFTGEVINVPDSVSAGVALKSVTREGDNILLKASHSISLEKTIDAWR